MPGGTETTRGQREPKTLPPPPGQPNRCLTPPELTATRAGPAGCAALAGEAAAVAVGNRRAGSALPQRARAAGRRPPHRGRQGRARRSCCDAAGSRRGAVPRWEQSRSHGAGERSVNQPPVRPLTGSGPGGEGWLEKKKTKPTNRYFIPIWPAAPGIPYYSGQIFPSQE